MTTATHLKHVSAWLFDLANLTVGSQSVDVKPKVAALASVIADAFPDPGVFTKASLVHVAQSEPYFPPFAKLHKLLGDWWDANRPKSAALMSPALEGANLSNAERTHVSIWQNHSGAGDLKGGELKMRLDVLRYHQPKAYHWLIEHDLFAAEIAVKAGWRDPLQREPPRTDDDVAAVASVVRGAVYGVSVPKDHAPGVSKPLPDEPQPVRKSVAPTPEQIDALRENNPLLKSLVMRQQAEREAQETPAEPSPSSDVKGGLSELEQKPTGGFGGESGLRWDDPPADLDEPNVVPLFPWRT